MLQSITAQFQPPIHFVPLQTADYQFPLPPELIAQQPAKERSGSRLLVLNRRDGSWSHRRFSDLPDLLVRGEVLVLNDSKVIPARLRATHRDAGGEIEILLIEENSFNDWWAMMRPARRAKTGSRLLLIRPDGGDSGTGIEVIAVNPEGHRRIRFHRTTSLAAELPRLGETPLPPYIRREGRGSLAADAERYQTVYAREPGSVAAPTAGLHFTSRLLDDLRARGVAVHMLTLHVGLGTFSPVKTDRLDDHVMHEERYVVPAATAEAINAARSEGRRVVAVGTTTTRVLESVAAANEGRIVAGAGRTRIFIRPPYDFRVVDALLTNFHLPRSTLLMLVSAFAAPGETRGRDVILNAYAEAVRERYRFFSYGDAMFIA